MNHRTTAVMAASLAIAFSAYSDDRAATDSIGQWADSYAGVTAIDVTWISEGQETDRPGRGTVAWYHLEHAVIKWPDSIFVEHAELIRDKAALTGSSPTINDFELASRRWAIARTPIGETRSIGLSGGETVEQNTAVGDVRDELLSGAHRTPWIVARVVLDELAAHRHIAVDSASATAITFVLRDRFSVTLARAGGDWRCERVAEVSRDRGVVWESEFADFRAVPGFVDQQPFVRVDRRPNPVSLLAGKSGAQPSLGPPVTHAFGNIQTSPAIPVTLFSLDDKSLRTSIQKSRENLRQERRDFPALAPQPNSAPPTK